MRTLDDVKANPEAFLKQMAQAAIDAADPLKVLPAHLPPAPKNGRIIVIGAGKASAAMARAVEQSWPAADIEGIIVTRYDYGVKTDKIKIIEAAHPVPDDAGAAACEEIVKLAQSAGKDDLVLCLISGGGSALLSAPAPCLGAQEKRDLNKQLLRPGANIHEINCLRKHLSAVKGGKLALAAYPARMITLVISDVPGDDPATVASGPTLPDPTTQEQARAVIEKYKLDVSPAVMAWLNDPANETPKADDKRFENTQIKIISSARDALDAATTFARALGVELVDLGDDLEGEAREVARAHIDLAQAYKGQKPRVYISGGETTVTMNANELTNGRANGRGGRNGEYMLAAMIAAQSAENLYGIAVDTDGIDGSEENAGAIFTPLTFQDAQDKQINPRDILQNNDSYSLFEATDSLVITGPTFTNVNDFRAILVL
jgi:hydroxypyruvate reductase